MHRTDVGKETRPHVLNVEDNDIDVGQLFGARFFIFSVNRNDEDTRFRVAAVVNGRTGIGRTAKAVLGSKHLSDIDLLCQQRI